MKHLLEIGVFCLVSASCAFGMQVSVFFSLEDKVDFADVIARVHIISEGPSLARYKQEKSDFKHHRESCAVVRDSILGCTTGDVLIIDHYDGFACGGVTYRLGEDCILLGTLLTNGHYSTVNIQGGKYSINQSDEVWWATNRIAYAEARQEIFKLCPSIVVELPEDADTLEVFTQAVKMFGDDDKNAAIASYRVVGQKWIDWPSVEQRLFRYTIETEGGKRAVDMRYKPTLGKWWVRIRTFAQP